MKTQVANVLIQYSVMNSHLETVLAHEIPILRQFRTVLEYDIVGDGPDVDVRKEFSRLRSLYKNISSGEDMGDVLTEAYPDGTRDIERYYQNPEQFDAIEEEEPEPIKLNNPNEKEREPEHDRGPQTREAIIEGLEMMGVEYDARKKTESLKELLDTAVKELEAMNKGKVA